ncbi:DUF3099 domain-containing protein [Polymorphospora sp. NPDC051019]|uniref:DUF3099 domain-containing protein n=1 Tax=Polymorphospora sp. NPDC051019 TaxID=3155725 RepID=UPI0034398B2C
MVKQTGHRPILITDAPRSQNDQLHSRQVRYIVMMLIRVACLIAGGVLITLDVPLLWIWLPLCGIGMVLVPWLAVLLANDRPPKDEHRFVNRMRHRSREEPPPRTLTAAEQPRIIDAD